MNAADDRVDADTGWRVATVDDEGDLLDGHGALVVGFWLHSNILDLTHLAGQRIRYRIQIRRTQGEEDVEIPDTVRETERLAREVADIRSLLGVSDVDNVSSAKRRVEELLTAEQRVALLEREPWLRTGIGTDESYHEQISRLLKALGCETTREALDALGREYTVDEVGEVWSQLRLRSQTWPMLSLPWLETNGDYQRFITALANALPPRIKDSAVIEELERLRVEVEQLRDENAELRVELKALGREYTLDEVGEAWTRVWRGASSPWLMMDGSYQRFIASVANALPPRINSAVVEELEQLRDENAALSTKWTVARNVGQLRLEKTVLEVEQLRDENAELRVELKSERQELERVTRELEAEQEAHRQTRRAINDALGFDADADAADALKELASWHAPLTEDAAKAWIAENWDAVADPKRWARWDECTNNFSSSWLRLLLRMLLAFANRHTTAPSPDWSAIQAAVASEDLEALRGLVGGEL